MHNIDTFSKKFKKHGNFFFLTTSMMSYKVETRRCLSDVLRRKKMRFRKISSQKFDPTGEFFHDSAIQMQAFIAFAAQKFGINENTFYLCNVKGEAK